MVFRLFFLFSYIDAEIPSHWPANLTLRKLLEQCLDIFGKPRRYFFELISFFTTDPDHRDKLKEFASTQGQVNITSLDPFFIVAPYLF